MTVVRRQNQIIEMIKSIQDEQVLTTIKNIVEDMNRSSNEHELSEAQMKELKRRVEQ